MAVIHITDVSPEIELLLAHIRRGDSVVIEKDTVGVAVMHSPEVHDKPRLLSAILADLERSGSGAKLPPGFAADVEDGIQSHQHETLVNPWE